MRGAVGWSIVPLAGLIAYLSTIPEVYMLYPNLLVMVGVTLLPLPGWYKAPPSQRLSV